MTSNVIFFFFLSFFFFSQIDFRRLLFDVNPNTGTISVINGKDLNWEGTNSYSPTLQAIDSSGRIGSTVVLIDIQDINDQTPEMNRGVYEAYVKENSNLELQIKVTLWL